MKSEEPLVSKLSEFAWGLVVITGMLSGCSQLHEVASPSGATSLSDRASILKSQPVFNTPHPESTPVPNPVPAPVPAEGSAEQVVKVKSICSTNETKTLSGVQLWTSQNPRLVLRPYSSVPALLSKEQWEAFPVISSAAELREQILKSRELRIPFRGYSDLVPKMRYTVDLYIPGMSFKSVAPKFSYLRGVISFKAVSSEEIALESGSTVIQVLIGWNPYMPPPPKEVPPEQVPQSDQCDTEQSPLAIKLDSDDVFRFDRRVHFDLYGPFASRFESRLESVSWGANIAWLTLPDANGNARSILELFGNLTPVQRLEGIEPAGDGYLALQEYDSNHDQFIDASDPVFHRLRVWRDKDADGISQTAELVTLEEVGIRAIELVVDTSFSEIDPTTGVEAIGKTIVHMSDGSFRVMTDLWLK